MKYSSRQYLEIKNIKTKGKYIKSDASKKIMTVKFIKAFLFKTS